MYISIKSNEPPPLTEEGKNLKIQFGDSAIFIPLRIIELIDGLRWNEEAIEPDKIDFSNLPFKDPEPKRFANDWEYRSSFPSSTDPNIRWEVSRRRHTGLGGVLFDWKCTCPSYTFSKKKPKTCKHIEDSK